jgi:hypothetical protein
VGDVEWLLGTTRGAPVSAEIDYTSFHRLSFRDKVSGPRMGLMAGRRERGREWREVSTQRCLIHDMRRMYVSLCVWVGGWVVPGAGTSE